MEITPYSPDLATELADLYNAQTSGVYLCWPVSADQLGSVLNPVDPPEEMRERFSDGTTMVIRDEGALRGFARIGIHKKDGVTRGVISFLVYERGNRRAGQMLLEAAHHYIAERADGPVLAFHQDYRLPGYHVAHAFLSDRVDHVQALLGMNGYRKSGGEVYLEWRDFDPNEPDQIDIPFEITITHEDSRADMQRLVVQAISNGEKIGECRHWSLGECSSNPDAQRNAFCMWLGVNDEWQGRKIGEYLLRRSFVELKKMGYEHVSISTAFDNYRAFTFYSNKGYRTVDWTYGYERPNPSA
jgi:ribosomal protein S18 acetylase RimI-like enzyme